MNANLELGTATEKVNTFIEVRPAKLWQGGFDH
jgi:hypothetical protein